MRTGVPKRALQIEHADLSLLGNREENQDRVAIAVGERDDQRGGIPVRGERLELDPGLHGELLGALATGREQEQRQRSGYL